MNFNLSFGLPAMLAAIAWLAHLMTGPTIWPLQVFFGCVIAVLAADIWRSR